LYEGLIDIFTYIMNIYLNCQFTLTFTWNLAFGLSSYWLCDTWARRICSSEKPSCDISRALLEVTVGGNAGYIEAA